MYRKLVVIGLALALLGIAGTAVTADEGAGPSVAEDLSPEPVNHNPIEDGGSGGDDGDTDPCSISPDNHNPIEDGGSC